MSLEHTPVKGKVEFGGITIETKLGIRRNLNISAGYAIKL